MRLSVGPTRTERECGRAHSLPTPVSAGSGSAGRGGPVELGSRLSTASSRSPGDGGVVGRRTAPVHRDSDAAALCCNAALIAHSCHCDAGANIVRIMRCGRSESSQTSPQENDAPARNRIGRSAATLCYIAIFPIIAGNAICGCAQRRDTIAVCAIASPYFALAAKSSRTQKDRAFQASSPKTFGSVLRDRPVFLSISQEIFDGHRLMQRRAADRETNAGETGRTEHQPGIARKADSLARNA